ncbi:MAG: hypothetical protein KBD51_02915 [Candidatus Levybacteria bacterium]|nr:hypothetical protein [Candidatus Levybacteria bacterium]
MNNLTNKKWWILFILILVIIFVAILAIFLINSRNANNNSSPTLKVNNLEKDYSRLDEITPGKTTLEDVKEINGEPKTVTNEGRKTYLSYKTPSEAFENIVVVENNRVIYVKENVFGSYRGTVGDFQSKNGDPDLLLFGETYGWSVYLNKGVAIEHDSKDIGTILYFVPQSKESFMNSLAKELKLTETPIVEDEPPFEGSTEATPTP